MPPRKRTAPQDLSEQVGETFVVVAPKISIHIPVDEDGDRPASVRLGTGREVDVVDEHITLTNGDMFGATTDTELARFRSLVNIGYLRPAPAAQSAPVTAQSTPDSSLTAVVPDPTP